MYFYSSFQTLWYFFYNIILLLQHFNSWWRNIKHILICFDLMSFAYLNLSITFNCITFVFYVFAEIKVLSTSWKLHSYPSIHAFGYFLGCKKARGRWNKCRCTDSSGFRQKLSTHKKQLFPFPAINSYLGHLPRRLSSILYIILKDALGNAREELEFVRRKNVFFIPSYQFDLTK